jgi:hypothetical protein
MEYKMKKIITILCLIILSSCQEVEEYQIEDCNRNEVIEKEYYEFNDPYYIYVDKNNYDGDGTIENPFRSLQDAFSFALSLEGIDNDSIQISIREGVYTLYESVYLSDSNKEHLPIIITNHEDEVVVFSGGVTLENDRFKLVENHSLIRDEYIGKIYEYDLSDLQLSSIKKNGFGWAKEDVLPELFVDSKSQTLSRFPNDDFIRVDKVLNPGFIPRTYTGDLLEEDFINQPGPVFTTTVSNDRLERWSLEEEVWMFGYFKWDWADDNLLIESIDKNVITAKHPSYYGIEDEKRFYVYNLLSELDSPGEWFYERSNNKVYYYPETSISDSTIELSNLDEPLMVLETSNVIIDGLKFELSRDDGVQVYDGSDNVIMNSTFSNLGSKAIEIGNENNAFEKTLLKDPDAQGGNNNVVFNNKIYDTGSGGIYVVGGNRDSLVPGNHQVLNNYICNFSRVNRTYTPGISLTGVGHVAKNNEIHNAPHMAIKFAGNNHEISFNEIYDVAYETSDVGVIYSVRDWTYRGNLITNNFIHHIQTLGEGEGSFGIYLDDMMSSAIITNNIFYKIENSAFLLGGGRDHLIENNLVIDSYIGIYADARGTNWAEATATKGSGELHVALNHVPYQNEIWSESYPELTTILEEKYKEPEGNTIRNNLFIDVKKMKIDRLVKRLGNLENNKKVSGSFNDILIDENNELGFIFDSELFKKYDFFKPFDTKDIGRK